MAISRRQCFRLYSHCIAGKLCFSWPHKNLSSMVWTATPRIGTSRSHTSSIAPAQLTERFRLLPSQWVPGLAPTYFVPPTGRIYKGIHTAPIMAQNLSDMWRSTFEISAAQLNSLRQKFHCHSLLLRPVSRYPGWRHILNRRGRLGTRLGMPQPFLCVIRHPVRCDFRGSAKAVLFNENIA